ncbi:MAG: transcription antitermination factor NusB [Christensenellales bacterium]|jgi:N utilization substance protein B
MSRKIARETCYHLIFEYLFLGKANDITFNIVTSTQDIQNEVDYIRQIYRGVIQNYEELVDYIARYSETFSMERIFRPDLAAMLIAIYEMKYMDDIPMSVSINEAIEIVKRYSTEKSGKYVNGILSSVYKELTRKEEQ